MDARGKVLSSFHVFKNIAVYAKVEEKHVTIYLIFEVEKWSWGEMSDFVKVIHHRTINRKHLNLSHIVDVKIN